MKKFKSQEFGESEVMCRVIAEAALFTTDKTVESIPASLFKIIKDIGYYVMWSKNKDLAFVSLIVEYNIMHNGLKAVVIFGIEFLKIFSMSIF